jgi:superfamily II DNA or RNA helicase
MTFDIARAALPHNQFEPSPAFIADNAADYDNPASSPSDTAAILARHEAEKSSGAPPAAESRAPAFDATHHNAIDTHRAWLRHLAEQAKTGLRRAGKAAAACAKGLGTAVRTSLRAQRGNRQKRRSAAGKRAPKASSDDGGGEGPPAPHEYQLQAIDALYDAWKRQECGALIAAPCGAGKTLIILRFLARAFTENSNLKIIVFCRSTALVEQHFGRARAWFPQTSPYLYSSGLENLAPGVMFATAQSMAHRPELVREADWGIIDEAHQASRNETLEYGRRILPNLHAYCGLTGTPFRLERGQTVPMFGAGEPFSPLCFFVSKEEVRAAGRMVPAVPADVRPSREIDLKALETAGASRAIDGDYPDHFAEARDPGFIAVTVRDVAHCLEAHDAPFLDFCSTVEQARLRSQAYQAAGIDAPYVTQATKTKELARVRQGLESGALKGVVSCRRLDTGFDLPCTRFIIFSFATRSRSRAEQLVARGQRAHPDKEACFILDYGGNCKRFGSFDWDYPQAIAYDTRRRREEQNRKQLEKIRPAFERGERNTLAEIRPDTWLGFEEDVFEIAQARVRKWHSQKGNWLCYVDLLFANAAAVFGIWAGCEGKGPRHNHILVAANLEPIGWGPTIERLCEAMERAFAPGKYVLLRRVFDDYWQRPVIMPAGFVHEDEIWEFDNRPVWRPIAKTAA